MRRAAALLGIVMVAGGSALADTEFGTAAKALRSDPVFVADDAEPSISAPEARGLRRQILRRDVPIFIAILPSRALDEVEHVDDLPIAMRQATRLSGAYGIVAGRNFRAGASFNIGLERGEAGRLATQAFESNHPNDTGGRIYPMLATWVRSVQSAMLGRGASPPGPMVDVRPVEEPYYRPIVAERPGPGGVPGWFIGLAVLSVVGGIAGSALRGGGSLAGWRGSPGRFRGFRSGPWRSGRNDSMFNDPSGFDTRSDIGGGSWSDSGSSSASDGGGDSRSDSGGGSW